MYEALLNENSNISPEDARDRIEKDCAGIWAKRTILDALPEEAKNQEKQKAGRLRQKEHNSAGFSGSTLTTGTGEEEIVVAAIQGKSVEEDIPLTSDLSAGNSSLSEYDSVNANSLQTRLKMQKIVSNLNECSSCQDLRAELNELRDALRKATQLIPADQISQPSSSADNGSQLENSSNILHFEFSLPLEDVRKYIISSFNVDKIKDYIWFSVTFDKSTGKVLSACTGRKSQQSTTEDHSGRSVSGSYDRIHH